VTDLRRTLHGILRDYGHNVYLQRRVANVTNGPYVEPRYTERLEKHTVREMIPSTVQLANILEEQTEGNVTTVDKVYWFMWDVNPKKGDRIYDDRPTGREIYTIDYAYPYRGQKGRIEYWGAGVTRAVPN
jgi:hypothetical protein